MAVYKQCITGVSPIRVSAAYPAYSDGSPHGGIDTVHISIHALLAESDFQLVYGVAGCVVFLSTLSLRRATIMT